MKIKLSGILQSIIVVWCGLLITPYGFEYCKELILAIGVGWIILVLFYWWNQRIKFGYLLVILGFYVWEVLLKLTGYSTAAWSYYGIHFLAVVTCIMCFFMASNGDKSAWKRVSGAIWIVYLVNFVDNLYLYMKYGEELNILRSNDTAMVENALGRINAGTTLFCYIVALMGVLCFVYFIEVKKVITKLIMFIWYLLSFYFVAVLMGRGIATLILLFGSAVVLMIRIYQRVDLQSWWLVMGIICVCILIGLFCGAEILDFIIPIVFSSISQRLALKLSNIRDLLAGVSSIFETRPGDSLTGRIYMIIMDIRFFFSNIKTILIGNGFHKQSIPGSVYLAAEANKASGHSDIFDALAQYGIIGGIYIGLFIKIVYVWGRQVELDKQIWTLFIILFILLGLFGNWFHPSMVAAVLLLLPGKLMSLKGAKNEN